MNFLRDIELVGASHWRLLTELVEALSLVYIIPDGDEGFKKGSEGHRVTRKMEQWSIGLDRRCDFHPLFAQ
jgi:hypothetical protein